MAEDWVSCTAVQIKAPITMALDNQLALKQASIPLTTGQYPPTKIVSRLAAAPPSLIHAVFSSRFVKKESKELLEFTLGMPLDHPTRNQHLQQSDGKTSLIDIVGQTDTDLWTDHPPAFDRLIRQDVSQPEIKGATEQVPQKKIDLTLTQYATENH